MKPEPESLYSVGAISVQATPLLSVCFLFPTNFFYSSPHDTTTQMENQLELNPNSLTELSESSAPSDDDEPALSSHTLAALKEFLAEQQRGSDAGGESEVSLVSEDWRLSQFWYSPETATTVAEEVLALCGGGIRARVACIACPTLYAYLKVRSFLSAIVI